MTTLVAHENVRRSVLKSDDIAIWINTFIQINVKHVRFACFLKF